LTDTSPSLPFGLILCCRCRFGRPHMPAAKGVMAPLVQILCRCVARAGTSRRMYRPHTNWTPAGTIQIRNSQYTNTVPHHGPYYAAYTHTYNWWRELLLTHRQIHIIHKETSSKFRERTEI
jgi:hypothetical protein